MKGNRLDTPVMIAHARLLVLGSDNQRLHEELIAAGGALRGSVQEGSEFVRLNESQLRDALATLSPSDRLAPASLRELQTQIQQQIKQAETPQQLTLDGFSSEEQQQFARDLQFLELRSHQIDEEIEHEVARIAQRFADPQPRLFPVTVTYLVPERLAR